MEFNPSDLKGIYLRYIEHQFTASIVNGKLIAPPTPFPYAVVFAESAELPEPIAIRIAHKLDFYNLWILDQRKALIHPEEQEVIIRCRPASGIRRFMRKYLPAIEYSLFPKGQLEKLSDPQTKDFAATEDPLIYLYGLKRIVNWPLCLTLDLDEPLLR